MVKFPSEGTVCVVMTIGHSTRALQTFVHLLQTFEVKQIVDIRTVPRSRHNPQFNRETLPDDLKAAGIAYLHMQGLGGLRHPRPVTENAGWHNASFKGFADYMGTPDFENHLGELIELARQQRTALMCAEALPWRCHRSLISDALEVRGIRVNHIFGSTHLQPHRMTPFAHVKGTRLTYPLEKTLMQ